MLDKVSAPALPEPTAATRQLARITVTADLPAVRQDWEALLRRVPCSAYQTPAWIEPWLATLGRAVRPAFAVGYDADGVAIALLPLGIERRGGLRIARFLGGRDINTGLGLFDPAARFDVTGMRRFLAAVARRAGLDLYILANQPAVWGGLGNPLLALPHRPSPSLQHEADLAADGEAFLARTLSKRARKHVRQKEAKLAVLGPVRHMEARTVSEVDRVAGALTAQRSARYGTLADADIGAFLRAAAGPSSAAVELHALLCGDTIVATFAGARHDRHLSGMLISIAADPTWAAYSPGDLLLARVMARHCAAGTRAFDLGVGEARYKDSFCPRAVPLFDTVFGITWRGRAAACGWRVALAGKRRLKGSRGLWAAIARLRRAAALRVVDQAPLP